MRKDIAVIGMAVKLPGIDNIPAFWELIKNADVINKEFPAERINDLKTYIAYQLETGIHAPIETTITYHRGSYLDSIKGFDCLFFGLTPKQASAMDPHHRMILQTMYKAFEDAGYTGSRISKTRTGVFVGYANNPGGTYAEYIFKVDPTLMQIAITGNIPTMLANRISYFLDIHGPSMVTDCACSSSLVAVHNAKNALLIGDCDMAVVAGSRIVFAPVNSSINSIGIESSDGMTRPFDKLADGTGYGEGSGAVILKLLDKAINDHDHIYAVIKGSMVNHDGYKQGITNPDAASQARLFELAWQDANVDPATVTYIEAHGTATAVGDPAEIEGIKIAYRKFTNKKNFCAIGTVKANIGHLYEGSGVMGFIKATLILKNKTIPRLANFTEPNPSIDFENSSIYIPRASAEWKTEKDVPRRCGVSAFGLGGTNCHVILEEFNSAAEYSGSFVSGHEPEPVYRLFTMSAETKESIKNLIDSYIEFLGNPVNRTLSIEDICYTANISRSHLSLRLAVICKDREHLLGILKDLQNKKESTTGGYATANLYQYSTRDNGTGIIPDSLSALADNYIKTGHIPWQTLYDLKSVKTVSLPAYSFENQTCWIEFPAEYKIHGFSKKVKAQPDPKTHKIIFVPAEYNLPHTDAVKVLVLSDQETHKFLPFSMDDSSGFDLLFLENADKIPLFKLGISEQEKEYARIMDHILQNHYDCILHALALEHTTAASLDELDKRMNKNLYSLFLLTKNMIAKGIKTQLVVLTYNALAVNESLPAMAPENSTLAGYCKVIPREYPYMQFKMIDTDDSISSNIIINEIRSREFGIFAYRNHTKYHETFEELNLPGNPELVGNKEYIKESGNYVITGGAGAIGMEVCRLFAGKCSPVNLFIINRRPIPDRALWNELINTSKDERMVERLKHFTELEATGARLHFYASDVADYKSMQEIIGCINRDYGRINGIVHAAGIPGKNIIQFRTLPDFDSVIKPKVHGTFILDQLTRDMRPDFIVYFSSVATVFPSAGQADYAAASYYMDMLAHRKEDSGCHTVAMDWVAWKEIGMAVEYSTNQDATFKALPTADGIEILDNALRSNERRVFGGEVNYPSNLISILKGFDIALSDILTQKINDALSQFSAEKTNKNDDLLSQISQVKIKINSKDRTEFNEYETIIAKIWGNSFGYSEINIDDDFYNLGGDSMLAISTAITISRYFNIQYNSSELMANSTLAQCAKGVASMHNKGEVLV